MTTSRSMLALSAIVLVAASANAEPIQITSGFFDYLGGVGDIRWVFQAPIGDLDFGGTTASGGVSSINSCQPCQVGETTSMAGQGNGPMYGGYDDGNSSWIYFHGDRYLSGSFINSGSLMNFEVESPSFVLTVPSATSGTVTLTAPFVVTGLVSLRSEDLTVDWIDVPFYGFGTATALFHIYTSDTFGPLYNISADGTPIIRYAFEAPAPVPEPMSAVLLGGGLATLVIRRRRRRDSLPAARAGTWQQQTMR